MFWAVAHNPPTIPHHWRAHKKIFLTLFQVATSRMSVNRIGPAHRFVLCPMRQQVEGIQFANWWNQLPSGGLFYTHRI